MDIARYLFTIPLILCLTACLKVTGPAKDPFDLEEEESSGYGTIVFGNKNDDESVSDVATEADLVEEQIPEKLTTTPESPSGAVDQQEYENFQKWKKERDTGSAEYQEFKEYQEYKLWLEFQREKSQ